MNSTNLYYYKLNKIIERISHLPGVKEWSDFHFITNRFTSVADRMNIVKFPLRIKCSPINKLPDLKNTSFVSYEECCDNRTMEIWNHHKRTKEPIYIFFSGGIDSTTILISFIKNIPLNELYDSVKIVLSTHAFSENPRFTKEHIVGKFEIISSQHLNLFDYQGLYVFGEHNDQILQQSHTIKTVASNFGFDKLEKPFSFDFIRPYARARGIEEEKSLDIAEKIITTNIQNCPINIDTVNEFIWWVSFNYWWQTCTYRFLSFTPQKQLKTFTKKNYEDNLYHFFGSENFQLWALKNPQLRQNDGFSTRLVAKDYIFKFTKDEYYRQFKGKCLSLPNISRGKNSCVGITEDYQHIFDPDQMLDFYQEDNDFI